MNFSINYIFIGMFIGIVLLGAFNILYGMYRGKQQEKKSKEEETKDSAMHLVRKLPEQDPETKLYHAVIEQLGDCYHIQFGTSLSTIVKSKEQNVIPEATVDILLVDPIDFTPKLAVFLTAGGRIWSSDTKHKHLEAMELLKETSLCVLSLPKQDFYEAEVLVTEMLDALDDTKGFYTDSGNEEPK